MTKLRLREPLVMHAATTGHAWQTGLVHSLARSPRGCRQKSLLQIITARSWQMARYDAALLA